MAVGDAVLAQSSINWDEYLTIQPASGDEYIITNIWAEAEIEVYISDGVKDVQIEEMLIYPFSLNGYKWIISNSLYLKIKNASSGATNGYIGYSGIKIKD